VSHAHDLDGLIAASPPGRQRERLRRAHDFLVQAGPLPELPIPLLQAPPVAIRVLHLAPVRARRRGHVLLGGLAAALVLTAAGGAYVLSSAPTETIRGVVAMRATAAAPRAHAVLTVGARDRAGNLPISLRVRGLPALPAGSFYEMYLTDKGRFVGGCGVFRTDGGTTVVRLSVPYRLGEYSGWIITRQHAHQPPGTPLLATA
jgi:hypothetical protein